MSLKVTAVLFCFVSITWACFDQFYPGSSKKTIGASDSSPPATAGRQRANPRTKPPIIKSVYGKKLAKQLPDPNDPFDPNSQRSFVSYSEGGDDPFAAEGGDNGFPEVVYSDEAGSDEMIDVEGVFDENGDKGYPDETARDRASGMVNADGAQKSPTDDLPQDFSNGKYMVNTQPRFSLFGPGMGNLGSPSSSRAKNAYNQNLNYAWTQQQRNRNIG